MGIYDRDYMKPDYAKGRAGPSPQVVVLVVVVFAVVIGLLVAAVRMVRPAAFDAGIDEGVVNTPSPRPVDVNRASVRELDDLPSMSPRMAQGIVQMRPFTNIDDLIRVKGIGPKSLERIRPYLFVGMNDPGIDGHEEAQRSQKVRSE